MRDIMKENKEKIMRKKLFFCVLFVFSALSLFAGPFGLEFGMTEDEMVNSGVEILYQAKSNDNITGYLITPKSNHPNFSYYYVFIDDEYGIYLIRAVSDDISSAQDLWDAYYKMTNQLSSVYGKGEEIDYTNPNSIWNEDMDIIYALEQGERYVATIWYPEKKTGVSGVTLSLSGSGLFAGLVSLEYASLNYPEVEKKIISAETSVL